MNKKVQSTRAVAPKSATRKTAEAAPKAAKPAARTRKPKTAPAEATATPEALTLTREPVVAPAAPAEAAEGANAIAPGSVAAETQLEVLRAETAYLRQRLQEAEEQVARLKNTISYRLGETLIQTRSFDAFVKLPQRLMELRKASEEKRSGKRSRKQRPVELDPAIREQNRRAAKRAAALTEQAKALREEDLAAAIALGEEAVALEPKGFRLKWLAGLAYDAGMLEQPRALLERAWEIGEPFTPEQTGRLEVLRGLLRVKHNGIELPPRAERAWAPKPKSVAYVAASSLPHHVTGYTLRTHGLARAIKHAGWTVDTLTRPGYPWDRPDAVKVSFRNFQFPVDDLVYERLMGPGSNRTAIDEYISAAAASLGAVFEERRPAVVHAASNYVNALPALVAARRAGLPFVYEVRGLWELTSAQRTVSGETSERFEIQRGLETLTARQADAVLAINDSLKDELVRRGVAEERISVAPNSVDLTRFTPIPRDEELKQMLGLSNRFVLGFIGSIVDYEGLDDAVEALNLLQRGAIDAALLVVGGGSAERMVAERAAERGLSDRLVMTGRIAPEAVPRYYSIIDVAIFPRKPVAVAETVSPLKPLEAMAMRRPVVASNVAAMAEMVQHDRTGLLFEKGDLAGLATAIARIYRDPALGVRLGETGRAYVEAERTWDVTAARVLEVYESLPGVRG